MPYVWLIADEIIEIADGIINADGSAACPYFGRGHLYTGPYEDIYKGGNILDFRMSNHARAQFLAPHFGALLIDDMNVSELCLENVGGTGLNVYKYLAQAYNFDRSKYRPEADRVMRHVSGRFIDDLHGDVTTSVIAANRNRIFFDTEYPHMSSEAYYLVKGIGKAKDIRVVNDGPIGEIRRLYKKNAIELGYRVICVNEIDKLNRLAWDSSCAVIMQHCLDVQEYYMIDRQKMWRRAVKELLNSKADFPELIQLDRKLNADDRRKRRSPEYCFGPAERLSDKEQRLFIFVVSMAAKRVTALTPETPQVAHRNYAPYRPVEFAE